jgi:hypothetical protein
LELKIDSRYVSKWRDNDWSFYDIAWVFWIVLASAIGVTIVAGLLPVDDAVSSITWILAVAFLFIGAIVAWILGSLWCLVFRRYHLMLSRTFDVEPDVMCQELDGVLPLAGVDIKDVSRPRTNGTLYESQVVYLLNDGTTRLTVLGPIGPWDSRPTGQSVVHLGPLGKANADLMETVRGVVDSVTS